jgi:hypothetical protein
MMINLGSKEWLLHTLVCVLIFLTTEVTSQVVPITIIEGAVAKGAGKYDDLSTSFISIYRKFSS